MEIKRTETVEVTYHFKLFAEWNEIRKEFAFYAQHDPGTGQFYELGMNSQGRVIINMGRGPQDAPIAKKSFCMEPRPIYHLMWLQKNVENKSYNRPAIPASDLTDIKVEIWK